MSILDSDDIKRKTKDNLRKKASDFFEIAQEMKVKLSEWHKEAMAPFVKRVDGTFKSADNTTTIHYMYITPVKKPKMILQFVHGMAEHKERYVNLGEFLAQNDIAFFMCDNLGHGESIIDEEHLGYFGPPDGWKNLVMDTKTLNDLAKRVFPDCPVVLGGHSMGSFIVRAYLAMFPTDVSKAVLVGTGNSSFATASGKYLSKVVSLFKGPIHRSQLLQVLSFGPYNKRISEPKTVYDWLSHQEENVRKYMGDPLCGFTFTTNGFASISEMLSYVSHKSTMSTYAKGTSIYLMAGKDDPVGNYGKDIKELEEKLVRQGVENVKLSLYPSMRHEIFNEYNSQTVYDDLLSWLNAREEF